jgi:hypothetical protein
MRLAFGGEQRSIASNDLLKDGNSKGMPEPFALFACEQWVSGPRYHYQCVSKRGDPNSEQALQLRPCAGDGRGLK